MDDFFKLKLDKLKPEVRKQAVTYLLGIHDADKQSRKKQLKLSLMADYTDEAKEIADNWGKFQGLSSGFPSIDKLTRGFVGGEITVIAAKTSVGKTALAVNMANNVAISGVPVLFVTLEMTKAQLASRYVFINGGTTEDYYSASAMTVFQHEDELDWKSIDGLVENFVNNFGPGLVVIDHLHYFAHDIQNLSEDIGRIIKEFSKNAKRHNVPVILISHVRKTGAGDSISIEDLRGSSLIGQHADIVLLCGRNDDGDKIAIRCEKNRNRGTDPRDNEVEMRYDRTKISELIPSSLGGQLPVWNTQPRLAKQRNRRV